ncbi:glycosyltransferase [Salinibacterium sp. G-O1]|uniref:glycosyltransferase n=1 Tax=Salinibacterium sp. G-O1 TaxID=3046208 RepID=UPI0024BA9D5C|nr:glycosyltransferase [Salinibacterium sp. G-O1]MDJ0335874.1 glycosyltransferase [Salinibacterium sp. G-O1]
MTLLIICPDYASHLLPLATLGTAWRDAGQRVVVATGPATAPIVESFGFERVQLQLGKGSNPGVIRAEDQPAGEDDALRGFFDATRRGMTETLAFQAEARLSDFMWEPVRVGRDVQAVVESVAPDAIIVDHLAFSSRLALDAAGISYADVLVGHPSALPLAGEVYGFPPAWPGAFAPEQGELETLRRLCDRVSDSFTAEWNAALAELNPSATPSESAFAEHGDLLLLNYPEELADDARVEALPRHVFLGSSVREEAPDPEVERWLASSDQPFVYVSFGSFLSVRSDVTAKVASSLESLGLRVALALGSGDRQALGDLPDSWLVREFLPQVRLLGEAAAAVTHGGNNSVTEAMTFGVPLVVLPFSTDQFAGAEAIEREGFGVALAPNEATVAELQAAISAAVALPRDRFDAVSSNLRQSPGSVRAFEALAAADPSTNARIAVTSPAASL